MSRQVLLVDDHASNLRLSEMAVKAALTADCEVFRAETYTESAILLDSMNVDVALLDIELPDGNGLHLAHQLRRQSPDALIVVLSVRDEREIFDMAYRAGVDAYITKPYNMSDVLQLFQDLDNHQLETGSDRPMWVLYGSHGLAQYPAVIN